MPESFAGLKKEKEKEKRANDWHLTKEEYPITWRITKKCLEIHVRALWCLPHQNAIPPKVSEGDIAFFANQFANESDIKTSVHSSLRRNVNNIRAVKDRITRLKASFSDSSLISVNISRIKEPLLEYMFEAVALAGLSRWSPDVLSQDPESMYNLLHEHVALATFMKVVKSGGYDFMAADYTLGQDFMVVRQLYRSFVFSYFKNMVRKEAKKPGAVIASRERDVVVKRMDNLGSNRVSILKAEGFRRELIKSQKEYECHSDDDEGDAGATGNVRGPVYYIREKEGRSSKYTNFYHQVIDTRVRQRSRKRGAHKKQTRPRLKPSAPQAQHSRFWGEPMPKDVFVDYFQPSFWNGEMTLEDQVSYIRDGELQIGMPPARFCESWEEIMKWKGLSQAQIQMTYGKEVLKDYHIPTPEEIKQVAENQNASSSSEEEEEEDTDLGDDDAGEVE
ncbi:hypothetical protein GALMADRAFT_149045 [Galerina marginata CBS 339.88]|uniref:Uncharacterized protein n=1 Tax=Galerina marginata (strain CBS 339.88) TaxID=685588 RepID=A0A067S2P1_GALM3|nr:hypothetical protein GALMADRAFT_149045 [Galerina marginata CBS 339.88]